MYMSSHFHPTRTEPRWTSHEEAKYITDGKEEKEEIFLTSSNLQLQNQGRIEKVPPAHVKDSPSIRPLFSTAYTPYVGLDRDSNYTALVCDTENMSAKTTHNSENRTRKETEM